MNEKSTRARFEAPGVYKWNSYGLIYNDLNGKPTEVQGSCNIQKQIEICLSNFKATAIVTVIK